jgi:hypothetical protein
LCGNDLKRKWLENPQLCRRTNSKSTANHSSNEQRKDLPRRTSNVTPATPFVNVSSPTIVVASSALPDIASDDDADDNDNDNVDDDDDDDDDDDKGQAATVKCESV